MDPHSFRRRSYLSRSTDQRLDELERATSKRFSLQTVMKFANVGSGLMLLPILLALALIFRSQNSDQVVRFADARNLERRPQQNVSSPGAGSVKKHPQADDLPKDELLGGLLAAGFDRDSCLSRYQSVLYRKKSPHQPSPFLLSKLRAYEALHKRCGPHTQSYKKSLEQLESNHSLGSTDCKYVVWISFSGLGNRILSITSAFLYALLTNRVLLIDRGKDITDLFCEPFPESSWFLPLDFPIVDKFSGFNHESPQCYGKMLRNSIINTSKESLPPYMYVDIVHDYKEFDKRFFCDDDHALVGKVPWLIIRTDNYFVPSLFLMSSFNHELDKLFPEKGTVFHHLGRYLFHPSNQVWGLITRYYNAYLAKADERIGIQVRVFAAHGGPFPYVIDQIRACILKEKLLPEVDTQKSVVMPSDKAKLKAVLITSLNSPYFEDLRDMYWEHPTVTGDLVGVYQPSHEEFQKTETSTLHNQKAWAEMYLLSLTDELVTSPWSTFGYVAHGLGGLRPWILYKPENDTAPDPPCVRAMSLEPCFHAPPLYDCKGKTTAVVDEGNIVPHVKHCEDMSWGTKLVNVVDRL